MTMVSNKDLRGSLYSLGQALLWSLLPVLAKIGYHDFSPIYSLAIMNSCSWLAFAVLMLIQRRYHELKNVSVYPYIAANALLSGVIYYLLVFFGTQYSTAGNASIILLLEVFFAIVILRAQEHEHLSRSELCGALLMVSAAAIVSIPSHFRLNYGDLLLLVSGIPAVYANSFSKRARRQVSAITIMFLRTTIVAPIFWTIGLLTTSFPDNSGLNNSLWALCINGFFVIGISRILWIEAIHLIPISKANAIGSSAPIFTLGAAYLLLDDVPTMRQCLAVLPMMMGLRLLTMQSRIEKQKFKLRRA
jgi:drug/metabolite transporter (DMT)-like permease